MHRIFLAFLRKSLMRSTKYILRSAKTHEIEHARHTSIYVIKQKWQMRDKRSFLLALYRTHHTHLEIVDNYIIVLSTRIDDRICFLCYNRPFTFL